MEFKNIDNWKIIMKEVAKQKKLDVQDVQQRYVLKKRNSINIILDDNIDFLS
ncbi:MAG: hypothetical protein RR524_03975 [Erysipelotrichaceae bacterium]